MLPARKTSELTEAELVNIYHVVKNIKNKRESLSVYYTAIRKNGDYAEARRIITGGYHDFISGKLVPPFKLIRDGEAHVYLNGAVVRKYIYVNGSLEGEAVVFDHDNPSKLKSIMNYKANKPHGKAQEFNHEGFMVVEYTYVEGLLDGKCTVNNRRGDLLFEFMFEKGEYVPETIRSIKGTLGDLSLDSLGCILVAVRDFKSALKRFKNFNSFERACYSRNRATATAYLAPNIDLLKEVGILADTFSPF